MNSINKNGKERKGRKLLAIAMTVALSVTMLFGNLGTVFASGTPTPPTTVAKDHSVIIANQQANDPAYTTYGGSAKITYRYYSSLESAQLTSESKVTWANGSLSESIRKSDLSTSTATGPTYVFVPESESTLVNGTALLVLWNFGMQPYTENQLAVDDLTITLKGVQFDPSFTLTPFGENSGSLMDDFRDADIDVTKAIAHISMLYPVTLQTDGNGKIVTKNTKYVDADDTYEALTTDIAGTDTSASLYLELGKAKTYTITPNSNKKIDKVYVTETKNGVAGTRTDVTSQVSIDSSTGVGTLNYTPTFTALKSATDGYKVEATFKDDTTRTVTFDSNGGSAVSTQTVVKGGTATKPADPTKSGCTFSGWYKDSALTQAYDFSTAVNDNITLYAKWSQETPKYTVTFDSNGGSYTPASQIVEKGGKVTRPADPAKANNNFKGWYTESALTNQFDFSSTVNGNIDLFAKWESNNDPARAVKDPANITAPDPTDPTGSSITEPGGFVAPGTNGHDDNGKLDDKVIVPNKNTDPNEKAKINDDGNIELPDGGFIDGNGNGTKDSGETALPPSIVDRNGSILKYLVYVQLLDQGNNDAALTAPSGYAARLKIAKGKDAVAAEAAIAGYDYVSAAPASRTLTASALASATSKNIIKLYYKEKAEQLHVTFVTNGGTLLQPNDKNPQPVTSGDKAISPMTIKAGSSFAGWYEKSDFSGDMFNFNTALTADKTLYAKWVGLEAPVKTHTVKFDSQGGTNVADQSVLENGYVIEPKNPTKSGYTFNGWYTAASGGTKYVFTDNSNKITSDKTLYAHWDKTAYPATTILLAKEMPSAGSKMKISWTKVNGATKYVIYLARCNHNESKIKLKKVKTVSASTTTWTKKGLKKHKEYKFRVVAYKGSKKIASSYIGHSITTRTHGKWGALKSIRASKSAVTLNAGKTIKVSGKAKIYSGRKCLNRTHTNYMRYLSSDRSIATVSSSGKITGKRAGTCNVYVIGVNGSWARTAVTVK